MIIARLFVAGGTLEGFKISGHAGCGREGTDIVCAAVSSAAYMAANTITDVIGADCSAEAGDGEMFLSLRSPDDKSTAVLKGFELHLRELAKSYPNKIKVIYGGVR